MCSFSLHSLFFFFFFFFNDTATTEIYTLSLHDALPISELCARLPDQGVRLLHPELRQRRFACLAQLRISDRSEEHTSELQSRPHLVCRLLLEKKKKKEKLKKNNIDTDNQWNMCIPSM